MTYFAKLRTGYPDELEFAPVPAGAWNVYEICSGPRRSTSLARSDVAEIQSDRDQAQVRKTLVHFHECSKSGFPLSSLYDIETCHEAHTYKRGNPPEYIQVWRIRGGSTRIYFMYQTGKKIFILKLAAKRSQKLSAGEIAELNQRVALVLDACASKEFALLEISDGK